MNWMILREIQLKKVFKDNFVLIYHLNLAVGPEPIKNDLMKDITSPEEDTDDENDDGM